MELRPYQQEAVNAILKEWDEGRKRTLLVLPTGCGKTICFSKIAEEAVRWGGRVLILAHRGELLEQASDKLYKATGLMCAVEKAEQTSLQSWYRVVVGSVQTLSREKRLKAFAPDYFSHIIVDEAHHCLSDTYQTVLNYFESAKVLGVTATPDRGDFKNLGAYFESLAYEYTLPKAIKSGYLSPIKAMTVPLNLDLSSVGIQSGDFKAGDLGTALDPYLSQIADEMSRTCMERKTVVFLPLIATSQKFCKLLNERGFHACEVNGNSADRAQTLTDFENGKYNVICNSMLLTEGWDCPSVDCIVMLRPTKVRSLYCQAIGRGTRLHKGKEDLLILDFLWHTSRHELCRPAHLICSSDEVAKKMTDNFQDNANTAMDLEEAEAQAEMDVVAQREEALAKQLAEMRKRKRTLVDPLQFEYSIGESDLATYVPAFGWETMPASQKQLDLLEAKGIYAGDIECAGKAALLINRLDKRRDEGLSTPKQIRLLESKGFKNVGEWSMDSASKMIARIADNHWRTPIGVDVTTYKP